MTRVYITQVRESASIENRIVLFRDHSHPETAFSAPEDVDGVVMFVPIGMKNDIDEALRALGNVMDWPLR